MWPQRRVWTKFALPSIGQVTSKVDCHVTFLPPFITGWQRTPDSCGPLTAAYTYTLASWIIVYIRVFILRKFSDLYGLIWVYTLIWNSPFHPIRILFKSIRFLYSGKVNKDVKFPPKISFTKSNEFSKHMARKHNGNPPGQHVHRRPLPLHYLLIVKISWYSSH